MPTSTNYESDGQLTADPISREHKYGGTTLNIWPFLKHGNADVAGSAPRSSVSLAGFDEQTTSSLRTPVIKSDVVELVRV